MTVSMVMLVLAVLLFFIALTSRFWADPNRPPFNALVAGGLFCWSLSQLLTVLRY